MHPALKRFIENGERELASLPEPERTAAAERLHAEMLRKFMPDDPLATMMPLGDVAERTFEDVLEDEDEAKQDAELRILEKFDDNTEVEVWDGDREPRTRSQKTKVAKATNVEIRSWDGRVREKLNTDERPSIIIERAPDLEPGLAATPEPIEHVDLGDYFEEHHADYQPTRPYHDRVAGVMFRAQRPWRSTAPTANVCLHCGGDFSGRKGSKYCSPSCRKRAHESK
jgi:hypothetical protein